MAPRYRVTLTKEERIGNDKGPVNRQCRQEAAPVQRCEQKSDRANRGHGIQ